MIEKWQTSPITIKAFKLSNNDANEIAAWCGGQIIEELSNEVQGEIFLGINLPTMWGMKRCSIGDYIVQYETGSFDTLTSIELENTYHKVS